MTVETDLTMAAARLARSSPTDWERFLAAVSNYSAQQATNCIQSPLELLPVAQGRAQISARLYGLLAECVLSADKYEGKRK